MKRFLYYWLFLRESPVANEWPSQRSIDEEVWCCRSTKQAVEQTVGLSVIWGSPMWWVIRYVWILCIFILIYNQIMMLSWRSQFDDDIFPILYVSVKVLFCVTIIHKAMKLKKSGFYVTCICLTIIGCLILNRGFLSLEFVFGPEWGNIPFSMK